MITKLCCQKISPLCSTLSLVVQGLEKTMLNQDSFTEFAKMSFLFL